MHLNKVQTFFTAKIKEKLTRQEWRQRGSKSWRQGKHLLADFQDLKIDSYQKKIVKTFF